MKRFWPGLLTVLLLPGICVAADKMDLPSEQDRISYSVGFQVGGDFRRQGVGLNEQALLRGVKDALSGGDALMTREEMNASLVELKKKITALQAEEKLRKAEQARREDLAFLAENAGRQGVVTLANGLQYKILREGHGRQPTLQDSVTVEYRGTLVDGVEFDNTARDGAPATCPLAETLPGWKEVFPLMKEGAHWQVVLPSELAFGQRGPLANRAVIYDIELLSVQPGAAEPS